VGHIAETSLKPAVDSPLDGLTFPVWRGVRLVSAIVLLSTPLISGTAHSSDPHTKNSTRLPLQRTLLDDLPSHWKGKVTVTPLGEVGSAVDGVKVSLKNLGRGDVYIWRVNLNKAETFLYAGDKKGSARSLDAMTDYERPPDGKTVLVTNALFFARAQKIPLGDFKARDFKTGKYIVNPTSWGKTKLSNLLKSRSYLALPAHSADGELIGQPKSGTLKDLKKEVTQSGQTLTEYLTPYETLIGGGFELTELPMDSATNFFKGMDKKYGRVNRSSASSGLDGRLRRARTVIGIDGEDLYVVAFGTNGGKKSGASLYEAGRFMNDIIHTSFSMSLDGGGSTTFWYKPTSKGKSGVTNCKSGNTVHPSWLVVKVSDQETL